MDLDKVDKIIKAAIRDSLVFGSSGRVEDRDGELHYVSYVEVMREQGMYLSKPSDLTEEEFLTGIQSNVREHNIFAEANEKVEQLGFAPPPHIFKDEE